MEIKYGEKEILEFDINNEENFWPNKHDKNYIIDIELPEFMAKCPRSGYPDFATIKIQYTPNKKVIELKALKIYINSFMNRYISHENSANEIFDTLYTKLEPKWLKVIADFKPRGNVHTVIEIDSAKLQEIVLERLVTTAQAAEILGLSLQGIHYRIKKNQLKSLKKDGKVYVYVDDTQKYNFEEKTENHKQQNNINEIIEVKNEQIELLKKSIKWMKKQYISEIYRLEKNQKRIIEVFNSEIKLLQSAFNEMKAIYKPKLENKNQTNSSDFLPLKEFFVIMKRANKTEKE